jgi:RNA polymerase sigma-70 factor (ECF subfamily)
MPIPLYRAIPINRSQDIFERSGNSINTEEPIQDFAGNFGETFFRGDQDRSIFRFGRLFVDKIDMLAISLRRPEEVTDANRDYIVQEIVRFQPRLRAFVRCLLVKSNDVDDVMQEINAVLWEKADDFVPGTDFWAWATQVARYKVLNQIRKYGHERLIFDAQMLERMAEAAKHTSESFEERREALQDCLNKLSPAQRQLIDLRYVDGHAIERIAEAIGRPAGSIRQTLYRIRGALLDCIERRITMGGVNS